MIVDYYVSLNHATYMITVDHDKNKVVDTAPIAKWMRGKSLDYINHWLRKKKAVVIKLTATNYESDNK